MSSKRRINASRANGARSRGPVTPEGKERSARNAVRHGILAQTVVLQDESSDAFRTALAAYIQRLRPADDVELALVEEMATAVWRQRRCWAIEARMMDDAIAAAPGHDSLGRLTAAFGALAAAPQLGLMHRYETRLHMMFQRALSNLLLLQQAAPPNEPGPDSEQSTGTPDPPSADPVLSDLAPSRPVDPTLSDPPTAGSAPPKNQPVAELVLSTHADPPKQASERVPGCYPV